MSQRTMILIGAAVLVLLLGVGGLFFWRMRATAPAPLPSGQSASTQPTNGSGSESETPAPEEEPAVVSRGCAERESAEACSDAERYTEAVAAKDAARCADVSDAQARDLCVGAAAEAAADPGQCDRIGEDGIRTRCTERAVSAQARAERNPAVCAALGADAAAACEGDVFAAYASAESCAALSDEQAERCTAHFAAVAPPANLQQIPTLQPQGDEDTDGLTNAEEDQYGSDPFNRDSDGDTFSDGDEVRNGYSPTGPGRLQTAS